MKEFTKFLNKESDKDFHAIKRHNNSKWEKMTDLQKKQHVEDKKRFYREKWQEYLKKCETVAQKSLCKNMLNIIERLTR